MFKVSLLISIALHLIVIFSTPTKKEKKPIPKPKKSTSLSKINVKFKRATKQGDDPCPKFYTGIGVTYQPSLGGIIEIAQGSPAELAGINIGDVFIANIEYRGMAVGTPITVFLMRNGITIVKKLKIGKICIEEESP